MNITSKIAEYSAKNFLKAPNKEEWKWAIIVLMVARIFTIAVAVYAGYAYMHITLLPVIGDGIALAILSATTLLIIELLNMMFLSKTFKFMLHKRWGILAVTASVSVLIYIAGYHIATNGLAMKEATGVDRSPEILNEYKEERKVIEADYREQIAVINGQIAAIDRSPGGYNNYVKDGTLSKEQQATRAKLVMKIDSLKGVQRATLATLSTARTNQLESNSSTMTSTADRYRGIVGYIIGSQVVITFIIIFLFGIITREEKPEEVQEQEYSLLMDGHQAKISRKSKEIFIANMQAIEHQLAMAKVYGQSGKIAISNSAEDKSKTETTTTTPPATGENTQPTPGDATNTTITTPPAAPQRVVVQGLKNPSSNKSSNPIENISNANLGKLRKNTALTTYIIKRNHGEINLPVEEICIRTNAKKWKYHEIQNMLVVANIIHEPFKYTQDGK